MRLSRKLVLILALVLAVCIIVTAYVSYVIKLQLTVKEPLTISKDTIHVEMYAGEIRYDYVDVTNNANVSIPVKLSIIEKTSLHGVKIIIEPDCVVIDQHSTVRFKITIIAEPDAKPVSRTLHIAVERLKSCS